MLWCDLFDEIIKHRPPFTVKVNDTFVLYANSILVISWMTTFDNVLAMLKQPSV